MIVCDFCAVEPCGFWRSFTWKYYFTIVVGKICLLILLDGYSSYSGLVFPCVIHKNDIGFVPWVELNMKSLRYVLEQYLSWISCTYLLSILGFQSFTLHFKELQEVSTNKIHLIILLKYMNRYNSLQCCWLRQKHKTSEYNMVQCGCCPYMGL